MTDAPTNEPVDKGWTRGWERWLQLVKLGLSGWRKSVTATLAHDFASIAAGALASTTLTVKGVRQGDGVDIHPYSATAGIVYYGIVTANDTVTIYAQNVTAGAVDPASTTFRVIAFQQ
jgi:phage head maturation protease